MFKVDTIAFKRDAVLGFLQFWGPIKISISREGAQQATNFIATMLPAGCCRV